jgi:hypothetical protein
MLCKQDTFSGHLSECYFLGHQRLRLKLVQNEGCGNFVKDQFLARNCWQAPLFHIRPTNFNMGGVRSPNSRKEPTASPSSRHVYMYIYRPSGPFNVLQLRHGCIFGSEHRETEKQETISHWITSSSHVIFGAVREDSLPWRWHKRNATFLFRLRYSVFGIAFVIQTRGFRDHSFLLIYLPCISVLPTECRHHELIYNKLNIPVSMQM